ncbi:hypothetical protein AcV5_000859 [Taiwanofungus camphoratus]|nr:hypothetical protein AcV5_000859 [Antrodia cinnamomea]
MSSTLSVQESLYLMANRERLEQELRPLQNLLITASTAGERPYVPAIMLSGAGEFARAAQHGVPAQLEVMSADNPEVKANPWYSELPEGAVSEVGEESMEDTWWQADAVAGAKRTREMSVEVEVEETQRRKKVRMGLEVAGLCKSRRTREVPQRAEVDGVSWEEGMVEEDVKMEGMSLVERGRRREETKLARRPATASPPPRPLPRTPHKPKGILKPTTPVPSEDEQGRPLRRSSRAQSRSRRMGTANGPPLHPVQGHGLRQVPFCEGKMHPATSHHMPPPSHRQSGQCHCLLQPALNRQEDQEGTGHGASGAAHSSAEAREDGGLKEEITFSSY